MFTITFFCLVGSKNATQSKKTLHKGAPPILLLVERTKLSENKIEVRAIVWVVISRLGIATIFTLALIPLIYSLLSSLAPANTHADVRLSRELKDAEESNVWFG